MQPRVIPRNEHNISRSQLSRNALATLYRLHENGFIAYLVGGCVRDLLLGRTPKDFDIATDAAPGQIKRLFRNCRLVGRRFRLAHLRFQDEILEVSTFRAPTPPEPPEETAPEESRFASHLKDNDGMVLRDNVFGTPEQDALRRDFTINAMAYNIADCSVIDYSSGLDDLALRLIRPIGDPRVRFTEDPVRMIRAIRFAASHDFQIEPDAWRAICELAPTITRAAPARLYEEMLKLFMLGSARPVFVLLEASGLLDALFPALGKRGEAGGDAVAALQRNLECVDRLSRKGLSPSPALFLAALFGPGLEAEALERLRDGMPPQQALDAACTGFLEGFCRLISIPGKVGSQLRRILTFQPLLQRIPPRRAATLIGRPDFTDAMAYLYVTAMGCETRKEALAWWNRFLAEAPAGESAPAPVVQPPAKRRRRRRRRRGGPAAENG